MRKRTLLSNGQVYERVAAPWGLLSVKNNPSASLRSAPPLTGEARQVFGPPERGAAPKGLGGVVEHEEQPLRLTPFGTSPYISEAANL